MVVFGSVDHAKQAMERLQNFPIWGRPLRLAFSREDSTSARWDGAQPKRLDLERPKTAPQHRPAPSHLPSAAGERSEASGACRRIWDVSANPATSIRTEQAEASHRLRDEQHSKVLHVASAMHASGSGRNDILLQCSRDSRTICFVGGTAERCERKLDKSRERHGTF